MGTGKSTGFETEVGQLKARLYDALLNVRITEAALKVACTQLGTDPATLKGKSWLEIAQETIGDNKDRVVSAVCRKLGSTARCETAVKPLTGSADGRMKSVAGKLWKKPTLGQKAAAGRQGDQAAVIAYDSPEDRKLVCECEHVTLGEIKYAVNVLGVKTIEDLRRRTRVGMGTCQGSWCIGKVAAALAEALGTPEKADELAAAYLDERWKGMRPVGWGDTIREMELMQKVYKEGVKL